MINFLLVSSFLTAILHCGLKDYFFVVCNICDQAEKSRAEWSKATGAVREAISSSYVEYSKN